MIFKGLTIVALTMAVAGLSSCGKTNQAAASNVEAKVVEAPDPNIATVPNPAQFPLVMVEMRKTAPEISVNGAVAADVSRNVPVNVLTSGRVVEVRVRLGDTVKKGDLLLRLTSADMSGAISDFQKFQADEKLTKAQLDRSEMLFSRGAVAQKDLEVARDTYEKAQVDTHSASERIRILGGDTQRLSPIIEVRAPVAGTIIEQNVTNAAGVKSLDNSPNLFTIADLSHVWVLCDVYENNLSEIHLGDRASIQLNAYPDRHLEGRVSNISSLLDPATRSVKVRVDLPNAAGLLRPNMFATVNFTSQSTQSRMAVPVGAILRLQDRDWVYVKGNDKEFKRTEVQALPAGPGGVQEILSGVRPGDRVVANALQFSRAVENEKEEGQ